MRCSRVFQICADVVPHLSGAQSKEWYLGLCERALLLTSNHDDDYIKCDQIGINDFVVMADVADFAAASPGGLGWHQRPLTSLQLNVN